MCEGDQAAAAAKGQIELLLEEYRALRSEIDQRIGARATLVGFIAAGSAFIVSSQRALISWIVAVVVLAIVLAVWGSSSAILGRLGKRVRDIEGEVNRMAKTAYGLSGTPALLQWETSLASSPGWMRKFFSRVGLYKD